MDEIAEELVITPTANGFMVRDLNEVLQGSINPKNAMVFSSMEELTTFIADHYEQLHESKDKQPECEEPVDDDSSEKDGSIESNPPKELPE